MAEVEREIIQPTDLLEHEVLTFIESGYLLPSLGAAVRLQVAEKLSESPKTTEELVQGTATIPRKLFKVLRYLASYGVFSYDEATEKWSNTPASLLTTMDKRGPEIILNTSNFFVLPLDHIEPTLKTGQPAFELAHGKNWVEYLQDNPDTAKLFQGFMQQRTEGAISDLSGNLHFEGATNILDIGGGNGTLLSKVLEENPQAVGSVLELPYMQAQVEEKIQQNSLGERMHYLEGNFFDSIPSGFDTHIFKNVLLDWNDEQAEKILSNSRRAIAENGRLVVIEQIIEEEEGKSLGNKLLDLHMMLTTGGKVRTEAEYLELLSKAGYRGLKRIVIGEEFSILISVPHSS
jgi:SAM-dependent methyltransferase